MEHSSMHREKKWFLIGSAAVVLTVALVASLVIWMTPSTAASYEPSYPQETGFGDVEAREARSQASNSLSPEFATAVRGFGVESASLLLPTLSEDNTLYSPVSLYLALALCMETSDGATREEILAALRQMDASALRKEIPKLFQAVCFNNEIGQLRLANSLWLNNRLAFHEDTLRALTDNYYSYSYQVDFSDRDTPVQISDWVNENTAGKLAGGPSDFEVNSQDIAMLLNTIYFRDEWLYRFSEEKTSPGTFYRDGGGSVEADFMDSVILTDYAAGDGYTMASLPFKNQADMVFILPGEGSSPETLLGDTALMEEILSGGEAETAEVEWAVPKFSFSSSMKLDDILQTLGVKTAFEPDYADFSPLTDGAAWLSSVRQDAAISIDEKGCEAAAYTVMMMEGSARLAPEKREMCLDRPFLFLIMERDIPLFIGTVGNPSA